MSTPIASLDYRVIDADNHFYEPYDCCSRHIESKYADRAVNVRKGDDGLGRLYYGSERFEFMRVIQTDYMGAPGSLVTFFADGGDGVERQWINGHDFPEMMQRSARLKLMDEQNIEACIMLPTVLDGIEHEMHRDVEALYANYRSYNRWVEEDWGWGEDGRIFSGAVMSFTDPALAVAELERVLTAGAKLIHMMPRPIYGRSPADPIFDPFWARCEEAGIPVVFHVGDSGYNEMVSTLWSENAHPAMQHQSAFQWYIGAPERAITDTLAALILHNLFGRFPKLRVLSIENGSSWLPVLLKSMDKAVKMAGDRAAWVGGKITDTPSEIFKQNIWVAPFVEEDPTTAVDLIGVDRVLFGSDYPHPEGLLHPTDFVGGLSALSKGDIRKVMRSNAAEILGLPG